MLRITLDILAPIPVGHHVTALALERRHVLEYGGENWTPIPTMIVCDDVTRIVYTARGIGSDTMSYESLTLQPNSALRLASIPPLRGTVTSCVVRTDSGDTVHMQTILVIQSDPTGYR